MKSYIYKTGHFYETKDTMFPERGHNSTKFSLFSRDHGAYLTRIKLVTSQLLYCFLLKSQNCDVIRSRHCFVPTVMDEPQGQPGGRVRRSG